VLSEEERKLDVVNILMCMNSSVVTSLISSQFSAERYNSRLSRS